MGKGETVNRQFSILAAIAMILVVMGHAEEGLLTVGGLFPYYSFHIALFLFISGYFYKTQEEEQIGAYIRKKALHLLVPCLIWNAVYGVVVMATRYAGFYIGNPVSLRTLFVDPFLSGHQYLYNAPAWFVPALFLTQAANVVIRKLLKKLRLENEWALMGIYLCLGFLVVLLSEGGHVYNWYLIPGRVMYLLPCYQMGRIYRAKLEKKDSLPDWVYFGILFIIQYVLVSGFQFLAVSVAWCNGFANGPVIPFLTTVTGIAFWLRIARILTPALGNSRFWNYFGRNTFAVMMHHLSAFMVVKGVFATVNALTGRPGDFDLFAFQTDIYWLYLPGGLSQYRLLYVIAGIALPLLLQKGLDRFAQGLAGRAFLIRTKREK